MSPTYGGSRSQTVAEDFSILKLIEVVRRDGNIAAGRYEAGLVQLQRERGGVELQARIGAPLPDRQLLRDLGTKIPSAGGGLVTTEVLAVAEATRPQLVLESAGATVIDAPAAQDFSLPVWDPAPGYSNWITEGVSAPVFSGLAIRSINFSAKGCAARLAFSRRLAASASTAIEPQLLAELGRAVGAALERGFIQGDGSLGQPLGLLQTPGLQQVPFAAASPTSAELAGMVAAVGDADADLGRCRWLLHPSDLALLLRTQAASGGEMVVTWAGGSHRIHGFPVAVSTNLPEDSIVFGDFSTIRIAYFGPPQIIVDTFSNGKSATGETEIVIINYADIGLIDPALIVVGSP